jgi:beta-glucosidase
VLLKNDGGLLPLQTGRVRSIAVIGPFAARAKTGGGGSSAVIPLHTVDPLTGIRDRAGTGVTVDFADGSDAAAAAALAGRSDVAIVMVGDNETEGRDHQLSLSGNQDALVSAVAASNRNTVVVVKSGSAVLMPWADQVPAIVEAWYPGEEDGAVVAAVLFGDVNPSGKLPITFPRQLADLPANTPAQYPAQPVPSGTIAQANYSEGLLMGYRSYDARGVAPLFPFGFGLSYTTFGFHNLDVERHDGNRVVVTFDVADTGRRAGADVAQVYVGMPAAVGEPPSQLRAFAKVQLHAGQRRHVSLTLDARAFSHWDVARHAWVVTPGAYRIMVGDSSRDIALQTTVRFGGED